ncbi:Uncharacterised protein [Kurthia zopfii]|uniref:Uncharacterized protein n=1 Tax=Kurthia zopfii TaxID=1650 RepID=A0A8B4QAH8_9BACL|nr:hypothetical protein DFR61_12828 [Kurthia zopfii]STX09702.1 Uncharacterised protein [Kurthia zopfii]VEI06947.1 Uncharacterised protein [Kurthia zopfii]
MEFLETKKYNKQAVIFLVIHTVFLLNFAVDFFEFH